MKIQIILSWLAVAVVCASCVDAVAQPVPDYGMDFVTVGGAGNRSTRPDEVPWQPGLQVGSIPYDYRITRNEVTTSQYLDFIRAYAPYWEGVPGDVSFTGEWIYYQPDRGYFTPVEYENYPANAMWPFAARFVNWLHNGQGSDRASFETGVYELASGARERLPGATFWLPTEDEWIKSAYYDVNRYGPGQDGYWLYPNRGNDPLISALPADGGETNAGVSRNMPVGQYPNSVSPWGLVDLSGGESEWLEALIDLPREMRGFRGSMNIGNPGDVSDRLDYFSYYDLEDGLHGIRLASAIPGQSLSVIGIFSMILIQLQQRRRQC